MHGRVKTRTTEEQQELKRKEREKKLKLYRAGIKLAFEKSAKREYDVEALEICGQLLSGNPDIYTLWNFRREILLNFKETRTEDDFQSLMNEELHLTLQCLRINPKSYCGWHHREWILDNMPKPNWSKELALCNKYLEMDERNFHVWDHRRFVVNRSNVPASDEFSYSTSKITTNFSNYSSWHYRSRLLPLIYPDPHGNRPIREEKHKEELDLVQNACFTDPNDQSAWFYQRWLLGRSTQPLALVQVVVSTDHLALTLTQSLLLGANAITVTVTFDDQLVEGSWKSSNGESSHIWMFQPESRLIDDVTTAVVVRLLKHGEELDSLSVKLTNKEGSLRRKAQFEAGFTKGLTSVLEEQLDSCVQLLEMEPGSKWTLLTSMLLMQAIDRQRYERDTMEKLDQLLQIDGLRAGYYRDLRSRYVMEYAINILDEASTDCGSLREIDLSSRGLTAFYHGHHLSSLLKVNLANNTLSRSLSHLHALQSCSWLCLNDNAIENLRDFPCLPSLRTLLLRGNKIRTIEDLRSIDKCKNIISLDLADNPIQSIDLLAEKVLEILPSIEVLNEIVL